MPFPNPHYIVIMSTTTDDNINFIINNIVCVIIVIVTSSQFQQFVIEQLFSVFAATFIKSLLIKSARIILLDPGVDISKYRQ